MERAYNPQTGEYVFLVNNEWVKPTQTAENPKTGERAFLVNNQWEIVPGQKAAAPAAPATPTAPALNVAGKPILAPAGTPAPPVAQAAAPAPAEPPPYKNRVEALDDAVNLLEEGAPKEELIPAFAKMGIKWDDIIKHGQARGSEYFKTPGIIPPTATGKPAAPATMKGTEPGMLEGTVNLFKRVDTNLSDAATGFLAQTGGISPAQAGTVLARNAKRRAAAMPDSDTRAGMQAIGDAKTYGDAVTQLAKNPAATMAMLMEAVATSLVMSAPALALGPAGVLTRGGVQALSSGAMEFSSVLTDVLQDRGVNLLDANAIAEALNNPDIMAEAKEKGAKRGLAVGLMDGLTMGLAGRFLAPARALIAEGKLAGQAARKATVAAWGKELAVQAAGGAGGELAAQKLTGENKPAEVLMEALAEGVSAPLDVRANLREARQLEQAAQLKAAERIEPTLDLEALVRGEVPKTVQEDEAQEIEAITQDLIRQNIPADNARRIAVRRVEQSRKERIADLIAEPSDDPVRIRAKEHIDSGMDPVEAVNRARVEVQEEQAADALAETTTEGAPDVRETIAPAGGVSPTVAGQPGEVSAAPGVGRVEPTGVVPTGPDVAGALEGERVEPTAVSAETGYTPPPRATPSVVIAYEKGKQAAQERPNIDAYSSPYAENTPEHEQWMAGVLDVKYPQTATQAPSEAAVPTAPAAEVESPAPAGADQAVTPEAFEAKKTEAQKVAKTNFDTALDQVNDPMYGGDLDAAFDAYRQNTVDTLIEQGETDPDVLRRAQDSFDRLVDEHKGQAAPTTEDVEAQQAAEQTVAAIEQAAAAQEPKTKRGRKPQPLTEEQKTQKEKATKEYKRKYSKGVRDLERATAELGLASQPLDEGQFEDEGALKEAQAEKRANLVSAIRNLLSVEKNHRGTPLGNKAKALLADRTKISEKDYNDIKKGWEATQHSKSLASSRIKPNPLLKGRMSANAVLNAIIKTGTPFEAFLAKRIRSFLTGVTVHIVEAGDPTPERLKLAENYDAWDNARGVYMAADETGPREVYLRGASFGFHNGVNNVTALHELLHAALNHRIGAGLLGGIAGRDDARLVQLTRELSSLMENAAVRYGQLERAGLLPPGLQDLVEATLTVDPDTTEAGFEIFELPQEFLAYGLSDPVFQQFLMSIEGRRADESGFSRFVRSILKFLGLAPGQFTALSDLINVTDDMLGAHTADLVLPIQQRASKAAKQKQPPVPKATVVPAGEDEFGNPIRSAKQLARDAQVAAAKVRASREGEVLSATEQLFKARDEGKVLSVLQGMVRNNWQNMSHAAIDKLVRMPTMTFLANWSGVRSLHDIEQHMQNMVGMANSLTASAYDIRRMLAKELNPFFRSAKNFRTAFENLVYETTIARYDPSNPRNKVRNRQLDKMWADIGEKGRRMYKALQQHYENLIDLYSDLLDQQIENLQGLDPEAKKNLMAMLRAKFEASARITPYFPLVRYGDYWLRVSKGDFKGFYMFESVGDRNAFQQDLADEMREDSDDSAIFETGDTVRGLRVKTQASSEMLKGAFEAIDKEDFGEGGTEAKESLKDAIYQIYLNTMPEQSFRDMFIHRKDRTGFSTDVLRNVSASASKMSMQLARLKYAPMLRNAVSAAYDAVQGNSNLSPFAKEAERRANVALAGNTQEDLGDAIAGFANKASYFWFLSSAASALIQPASIYITALPVIGANHNDMVGAAKELGKMVTLLNQYSVIKNHPDGTWSVVAPSLTNSESLNDLEKDAVRQMFQRGVSQSTYTSLVWGYKNLPTQSASTILGKGKQIVTKAVDLAVGALMHNTERLTREATFLASYRLGYKQGLKRNMTMTEAHEAAINQAVIDVNESLANYDLTNRPRYMQQGIGRVLFQFKMFPLHTFLLLATNFFKMWPFLNKEGKAAAAKKFFGIYLTAGSIAGAVGIPAFSPILGAIAYAFKYMQDDDDLPDELKDKDPETWFRTVFLPDLLGDVSIGGKSLAEIVESGPLNAMTGLAISERIGLNDLFGRDTKEAKTAREGLSNWALEKAGPTVSIGLSMADAYDAYQLGDFQKAAEKLSPAVLRNILLAERMAKEGVKDSKGNVIFTPDEAKGYVIAQRIGFRPAELAKINEMTFKLTAVDQRIQNERNTLLGRMKVQARKQDEEGALKLEKIFNTEVARFNQKNPEYALDVDSVVDSLVKDLETRASARLGYVVTEKNARMADPSLYRMEQRLEKLRAKQ